MHETGRKTVIPIECLASYRTGPNATETDYPGHTRETLLKLLCVGDIHLGRQPSRLPEVLLERVPGRDLTPAAAWRRTVAAALHQGVDAVLLAGDVVEQRDDFYEAYDDLRRGVERLTAAGIQVLAVAGNHDVEVLPRLADAVPGVRLLGRRGTWETHMLPGGGGVALDVVGWSFPEAVVTANPLHAGLPPRRAVTTVGLLHCDRDQTGSRYAPVRSSELDAAPVDAWLLGHIHKPDALGAPRPMGYLGSLSGLDPGETGPHGPWLLEIADRWAMTIEHLPLAPLRWEEVDIPVDDLPAADDIHGRVVEALSRLHEDIAPAPQPPRAVGCRLRLTGRTALRHALERALAAADPRRICHERGDTVYFIHDWRLEALPAIDLQDLARASDPAGLVARKLQVLRGADSPARRQLIEGARQALQGACNSAEFADLAVAPPDETQAAAVLERAALRALDELLAQREASG